MLVQEILWHHTSQHLFKKGGNKLEKLSKQFRESRNKLVILEKGSKDSWLMDTVSGRYWLVGNLHGFCNKSRGRKKCNSLFSSCPSGPFKRATRSGIAQFIYTWPCHWHHLCLINFPLALGNQKFILLVIFLT